MTVHEVSRLTGVSIRTLQYYDNIGLLKPAEYTDAGYRLYDESSLEKLQNILLFRELEFPLSEIKKIVEAPDFDRDKALSQQIELLKLKKKHLEKLIEFAKQVRKEEADKKDFSAFDTSMIDEYTRRAKEQWGGTAAYLEYERKSENRSENEEKDVLKGLMNIFRDFGRLKLLKGIKASDKEPQELAGKLREYITENFYNCTLQIFASLADMYDCGGDFTKNIDKAGGIGTAEFAAAAIRHYCLKAR